MSYKDPKRKIGSQSEIPEINIVNNVFNIKGYQKFSIDENKNIILKNKIKKFQYIESLLNELKESNNCSTLCDFGCSAGLTSLIAHNLDFKKICSFDHDSEYIEILKKIKDFCNIDNINEKTLSFGSYIETKFDIVFCGALIHWIFSLTADYRNFDRITYYLTKLTNKYLIIEWITPEDSCILTFKHIERNSLETDEIYSTENFEKSINKYGIIVSKEKVDSNTRIIYVIKILD